MLHHSMTANPTKRSQALDITEYARYASTAHLSLVLRDEPNLFTAAVELIDSEMEMNDYYKHEVFPRYLKKRTTDRTLGNEDFIIDWLEELGKDFPSSFTRSHKVNFVVEIFLAIAREHNGRQKLEASNMR